MNSRGRGPISSGEIIIGLVIIFLLGSILYVPGLITNPEKTWGELIGVAKVSTTIGFSIFIVLMLFWLTLYIIKKLNPPEKEQNNKTKDNHNSPH